MLLAFIFGALALLAATQPTAINGQAVTQCGRRKRSRIVGGQQTLVNEFPMMAGLVQGGSATVFCGATIVTQWYAVTAAHCLQNRSPNLVRLLVGEHDYNVGWDTQYSRLYNLRWFNVHPGYSGDNNDIALVLTAQAIEFNAAVGPVCLPYGNTLFTGQWMEAVGWGTDSFGGKTSSVLQKTWLQVIDNQQCAQSFGNRIQASHICTYAQGRDACQYDSGGPLYVEAGGLVYLAGIISFGATCADRKPSVSTRVTYFADWIRQNAR